MKKIFFSIGLFSSAVFVQAQNNLSLNDVLTQVKTNHPEIKMYEADIRSQKEAAKGAYSWMPPELGTGFWMTPYNPKMIKEQNGMPGMGQYMVSAQQMLPNRKRQKAEATYMESMPNVTAERQQQTINELYSQVKKNYYQLIVDYKKISVLNENEKLIDFMIKSAEIRYRNGIEKLNAYYKAKASLGTIHNMKLMLQNDITQKKISLNTLMNRNRLESFEIDTTFQIKDYPSLNFDTASLVNARSDIRAINREIEITGLQQELERAKLKPEFGIRFDHMMGLSNSLPAQYTLMGMVKLPLARWSSRMGRANIESLKWKAASLTLEREATINEALGMAYSMKAEFDTKKKQLKVYEEEIIPALRRNYQTVQLAYEQNTEELFMLYDAWEKLNMTQQEYLDQLQQLLALQAELDRILEIKE